MRSPQNLLADPASRTQLLELLTLSEAQDLLTQLGVHSAENPYSQLNRLAFRKSSAASRVLHGFLGVNQAEPTQLIAPDAMQAIEPRYSLFPHQLEAAARVIDALASRSHRVMLHMPTGSGKTRTAMNIVSDHVRLATKTIVLWLAASEELCEQAYEEFRTAWSFLGNRRINGIRFWGSHEPGPAILDGEAFVVAGLQKLYSRSRESLPWLAQLGDRVSLVVFDEAHQAVAPTFRHVVDTITARREDTCVLGLSATPGRTWNNSNEDAALSAYFGGSKVTLSVKGHPNPVQ
jgi:superfamily II DNA or RNA helicase